MNNDRLKEAVDSTAYALYGEHARSIILGVVEQDGTVKITRVGVDEWIDLTECFKGDLTFGFHLVLGKIWPECPVYLRKVMLNIASVVDKMPKRLFGG